MVFVVLEGFSGSGKTTLASKLEERGWFRVSESAHILPPEVPVADRANTFADYSLLGATLQYSYLIASKRPYRNIVAEGYLISDLTYAMIRYKLKKSEAFPTMLSLAEKVLRIDELRPDLFVILKAKDRTIEKRQQEKNEREKNISEFFRKNYYTIINRLHKQLGQENVLPLQTDHDADQTMAVLLRELQIKGLLGKKNK